MRFALNQDHKEFYAKNGFIEFEDLLSPDSLSSLQAHIDSTLASRLKIPPSLIGDQPSDVVFKEGFDLWRDNDLLKKMLLKGPFSPIGVELFQVPLLRIGFTQYITVTSPSFSPFASPLSLNASSCVKPLAGALILCLSPACSHTSFSPECPLPTQPGNGIYLSAEKILFWNQLSPHVGLRLLLLAYAPKQAIYRLEKNDPHTHFWKSIGYVFGDSLNDNLHPIVYRS